MLANGTAFLAPMLGACALALLSVPASAHHSGAMFDQDRTWTFEGAVEEFQFTNPHSWLLINVEKITDENGNEVPMEESPTVWGFEAEGPSRLMLIGITKADFEPGEAVIIDGRPMKDGRPGAQWLCATKPDTGEEFCARGN